VRVQKDFNTRDLSRLDHVIVGGWVLGSKIKGADWIRKNWSALKGKKVVLFSTSGARPTNELTVKFLEASLPEGIRESIAYFPLHGRVDPKKLSFFDGLMMKLASRLFRDDPLVRGMAAGIDGVRLEALEIIIEHIQGLDYDRSQH